MSCERDRDRARHAGRRTRKRALLRRKQKAQINHEGHEEHEASYLFRFDAAFPNFVSFAIFVVIAEQESRIRKCEKLNH
jgi:hypothetical protein